MQALSQRDKRWRDIKLGTSNETLGGFGCTITSLSMILGTTPDLVNERLKQVQGYANGNLVIWAKLEEAFPGIKVRRVWTYDNVDVLKNVPNVLVEVDGKPIGGFRHWVVYIGNKKCLDPWDGQEDPTSDYPNPVSYCVIGGKWNKPSPVSSQENEIDNIRRDLALCEKVRNGYWDFIAKLARIMKVAETMEAVEIEVKKLLEYEEVIRKKEEELRLNAEKLEEMKKEVGELDSKLKQALQVNTEAQATITVQQEQLQKQEKIIVGLGERIEELKKVQPIEQYTGIELIKLGFSKFFGK